MALKTMRAGLALALMLGASSTMLDACATTPFNGYSPEPAAQISLAQNPYIHNGVISADVATVTVTLATSCHEQHTPQQADIGQAAINGAVPNAGAGFLGVGGGAAGSFPGAKFTQYGGYGAASDGAEGAVSGAEGGSYSLDNATADCTKTFVNQLNTNQPDDPLLKHFEHKFDGLDIEAATAGKAWGNDRPPALDKDAKWPIQPAPPAPTASTASPR